MDPDLRLFINRMHEKEEIIDMTLPSSFLDINEPDMVVDSPITITGKAYLVDEFLMICLKAATTIQMPCSICNQKTVVTLSNPDICFSTPIQEIPSEVFDYSQLLREEIVMLIPQFVECSASQCPERKTLKPYLKKDVSSSQNFPFAEL